MAELLQEVTIDTAIMATLYNAAEFEHLKAFLNDYIHNNYDIWLHKMDNDYTVIHMTKNHHLYHHHSFSNCVEWVFNNCKLDKETD